MPDWINVASIISTVFSVIFGAMVTRYHKENRDLRIRLRRNDRIIEIIRNRLPEKYADLSQAINDTYIQDLNHQAIERDLADSD